MFLKKHSVGVRNRKLSLSFGLALIFFLILVIFSSVTMLIPFLSYYIAIPARFRFLRLLSAMHNTSRKEYRHMEFLGNPFVFGELAAVVRGDGFQSVPLVRHQPPHGFCKRFVFFRTWNEFRRFLPDVRGLSLVSARRLITDYCINGFMRDSLQTARYLSWESLLIPYQLDDTLSQYIF